MLHRLLSSRRVHWICPVHRLAANAEFQHPAASSLVVCTFRAESTPEKYHLRNTPLLITRQSRQMNSHLYRDALWPLRFCSIQFRLRRPIYFLPVTYRFQILHLMLILHLVLLFRYAAQHLQDGISWYCVGAKQ